MLGKLPELLNNPSSSSTFKKPENPSPCVISCNAAVVKSYFDDGVLPSVPKYHEMPELKVQIMSGSFSPFISSPASFSARATG